VRAKRIIAKVKMARRARGRRWSGGMMEEVFGVGRIFSLRVGSIYCIRIWGLIKGNISRYAGFAMMENRKSRAKK
jgi:hypothetical protein